MRSFLPALLVAATGVAACNQRGATGPTGPQGPQGVQGVAGHDGAPGTPGPIGGGRYIDRSNIYCNSNQGLYVADGGINSAGGFIQAECTANNDLPVVGSCDGPIPSDTQLIQNAPISGWHVQPDQVDAGPALPAGWICNYQFAGSTSPHDLPSVTAHMCCIKF